MIKRKLSRSVRGDSTANEERSDRLKDVPVDIEPVFPLAKPSQ